jgi:hypothetical protein
MLERCVSSFASLDCFRLTYVLHLHLVVPIQHGWRILKQSSKVPMGKPVLLFGRLPQPCAAGAVLAKFFWKQKGSTNPLKIIYNKNQL